MNSAVQLWRMMRRGAVVSAVVGTAVVVSVSPVRAAPPDPPTGVAAVVDGSESVEVTWTAPAGGTPPDTYNVYIATDAGGPFDPVAAGTCSASPAAGPCTVTGLTAGGTYYFTVAGVNVDGEGAQSAPSVGTTALTVPAAPATPTAAVDGDQSIAVSWTGPTATAAAPVDSYEVRLAVDGGGFSDIGAGDCAAPATTSCVVTGLAAGSSYQFEVLAVNDAGAGPASPASPAVVAITPPAAPDTPTVTENGAQSMSVAWTGPTATAAAPVDGYQVDISVDGGPFIAVPFGACLNPTASPCTISGLTGGESYRFRARAVNAAGASGPSTASNSVVSTPVQQRVDSSLDGDARDEVVLVGSDGTVRAWRNVNGAASTAYPEAPVVIGVGFNAARTRFADIDGDGRQEIVLVATDGTVRAWRNVNGLASAPYTESPVVIGIGFNAAGTRFADIDGDGRDEIVLVYADGTVRAWRNVNGLASAPYTEAPVVIGVGFNAARTRFADIDGDGRDEIVLIDADGTVRTWRNVNGLASAPYTESPRVIGAGFAADRTLFGDLDGDGKDDIIHHNSTGALRAFRNANGLACAPYSEPAVVVGIGFPAAGTMFSR